MSSLLFFDASKYNGRNKFVLRNTFDHPLPRILLIICMKSLTSNRIHGPFHHQHQKRKRELMEDPFFAYLDVVNGDPKQLLG